MRAQLSQAFGLSQSALPEHKRHGAHSDAGFAYRVCLPIPDSAVLAVARLRFRCLPIRRALALAGRTAQTASREDSASALRAWPPRKPAVRTHGCAGSTTPPGGSDSSATTCSGSPPATTAGASARSFRPPTSTTRRSLRRSCNSSMPPHSAPSVIAATPSAQRAANSPSPTKRSARRHGGRFYIAGGSFARLEMKPGKPPGSLFKNKAITNLSVIGLFSQAFADMSPHGPQRDT
jgi:hypothetical protein